MTKVFTHRGIELPVHIRQKLDDYSGNGRPVGDFLKACIENDLSAAIALADETNLQVLPAIVGYLYNCCDSRCWGRRGNMAAWVESRENERKWINHD